MNINFKNRKVNYFTRFGIYFVLIFQCLIIAFPLFLMVMSSFKSNREIFKAPFKLPATLNMENYRKLFLQSNYLRYFLNSIIVSLAAILIILIASSLASYAISKYRFPLNKFIFFYFLAGLMIPIRLGTINIMQMFIKLNLYNNLLSLIIIYSAYGIPAGILIFTGFMNDIPNELSDSARVDGCSEIGIFRKIIVPLLGPAIVVVAVYNLIPIWNDFWFPLVLINSDNLMTIPLATAKLFGRHETNYGLIFAILTSAAVPPMILFATLSRYFIKGLTAGAIKG
ncbi:MAG: carbohydrate ABC transporter permease [Candidatus Humimicrobiaceae bacterium]|jgi:raffinose/stachyose/melibiose transport system permease protein|nr:carbohydrate ABC transporter permease [Candidatus Humimicrobiaceae bacterium]